MKTDRVALKCFIEGIQVPIRSATRIVRSGRPTEATITIPPIRAGMKIIPNSLVHVFKKDDQGIWRLFFEGVYVQRILSFETSQDHFSMGCVSFGHFFESIRAKILELGEPVAYQQQAFVGFRPDNTNIGVSLPGDNLLNPYRQFISALSNNGVGKTFYDTISKMQNFGKMTQRTERTLKITKRVAFAENPAIQKVLLRENEINFLLNIGIGMSNSATMFDLINRFFPYALFDYVEIPSPKYNSAAAAGTVGYASAGLGQIVFKPQTFFAAPPTNNILFRNQYDRFSFATDYRNEPTRLDLQASIAFFLGDAAKYNTPHYYAPDEISEALRTITSAGGVGSYNNKSIAEIHSSEELYRGIVAQHANSPFSESLMAISGSQNRESLNSVLQSYAYYMFYMLKFQNRVINIEADLNMNLAVGFPFALVHDEETIIVGELLQTVDSVSADGQSQSSLSVGYSRFVSGKSSGFDPVDADHYLEVFGEQQYNKAPAFFSNDYKGSAISEAVYRPLLGTAAIVKKDETLKDALQSLSSRYAGAANKAKFTEAFTRRDIATEGEVMNLVLGATKTTTLYQSDGKTELPIKQYSLNSWGNEFPHDSENPEGAPFMSERRSVVREYAKLANKKALSG